jgi:poly(A) polymerase
MSSKKPNIESAIYIAKRLIERGYKAYLAGGCVRDIIMGREPDDYDIATNAKPEEIKRIFRRVIPVGEAFGVILVIINGVPYETATFRKDVNYKDHRHPDKVIFSDEKEDALRRDFTINGLFMHPVTMQVIDYVGGIEDIKKGIIRAIGDANTRFREDALRMLRAIRFSARYDFPIEEKTKKAIISNRHLINEVSKERVFVELNKIFTTSSPDKALLLLKELGLLKELLPEVDRLSEVEQPKEFHPEGDVFSHIYLMLKHTKPNPPKELIWAILLHDVGKYETKSYDGERIRFNNHDKVSERIAREVLKRLKADNKTIKVVCELVREHMKFMNIKKMRRSKLIRFLRNENFPLHLELHRLDCLGSHKKLDNYEFCVQKLKELKEEEMKPPKLVDGYLLMELGLKPSPLFSKILKEIEDLQLEGKIKNKEEAIEYIKANYIRDNNLATIKSL